MPNREAVFVDTSGWISLLNADDRFHAPAAALLRQFGSEARPLMTSDWVLAETGNGLARLPAAREQLVRAVHRFLASPDTHLVRMDADLFQEALALYGRVSDKCWGLVDCCSFVIMRRQHIVDALTTDHHFEQAGYRCLLTAGVR